jgi:hypothetical protein
MFEGKLNSVKQIFISLLHYYYILIHIQNTTFISLFQHLFFLVDPAENSC